MSPTNFTLLALAIWVLITVMSLGVYRSLLVFQGKKAANGFNATGEDLDGFGRRLTRVHANCYEFLPMAGLLLLYAIATGQTTITDGLAYVFLGARILQSLTHLISTSRPAVFVRFAFFIVQLVIAISWIIRFLGAA